MFVVEYDFKKRLQKSLEKARGAVYLNGQRQWKTDEASEAEGVDLPFRSVFAQNDTYLELCNPDWDKQWNAGMGFFVVIGFFLSIIWIWYGFAIHPLITENVIVFFPWWIAEGVGNKYWVIGWLIAFPFAVASAVMIYGWLFGMCMVTGSFTYLRGRIRFNRQTRKVYVLRPSYCGGNTVYDWDRLRALMYREPPGEPTVWRLLGILTLYCPASDPDDPKVKGEDAIFVGPTLGYTPGRTARFWEYIRRYMEVGPTVDYIPPNAPSDYKEIPRYLPALYTTYCGKPSALQYGLEQKPGFMETGFHMLSQMTCTWPRFPKEWGSDGGLGEPEDRPVQTGAVMTAMVYRAEGKLSPEDEAEFLRRWGAEVGHPEAMAVEK